METFAMTYDLAVIGGGSAGLSVAAAAAQFGQKVVLFEKGEMGGDCLNTGCVPSKSLLAAAKAAHVQRSSQSLGIDPVEPKVNYAKVMARVQRVIETIAPIDSQERFEGLGVDVVRAQARFTGQRSLAADGKSYDARRIVIATGSRAAIPPIPGLSGVPYFTNETLFRNRTLPKHLIIIGGGPIGLEMAQAHRRLGSAVTVLEASTPLAKDDPELSQIVVKALEEEGVVFCFPVSISAVSSNRTGVSLKLSDGTSIAGSHILVAAGRTPNIEGLDLQAAGIEHGKHGVKVDGGLRSTNSFVYAAGDIAGGLQFTHVAGYHAGLIIRNALFRLPVKNRTDIIPWVTYTDPELAHVGLHEAEARVLHGKAVRVLRWPFGENDRAQAEGKIKGLVKIIVGRRGRVLGAEIVGAGAGELIATWALAITQKLPVSSMANLVLPYPTFNEAGKRAATNYYAGLAKNRWVRRMVGILKLLG
jgi:pyruvate/2-oxoglutarate dehydrogenase complex dihydrolipoamide dehydrogenase (E3) component